MTLAQLSRYASDLASRGSADIGAALGGHVGVLFPGRNRHAVLESLLGYESEPAEEAHEEAPVPAYA